MIQIIFGKRGSGKTKRIIDMANASISEQKGSVLFIDDDNRYMYDLKHQIRFINASEYDIKGETLFTGFLNGILASNFDVSLVFIDAFLHLVDTAKPDIYKLEGFFQMLEKLSEHSHANFVISLSEDPALVPECIRKYQI